MGKDSDLTRSRVGLGWFSREASMTCSGRNLPFIGMELSLALSQPRRPPLE